MQHLRLSAPCLKEQALPRTIDKCTHVRSPTSRAHMSIIQQQGRGFMRGSQLASPPHLHLQRAARQRPSTGQTRLGPRAAKRGDQQWSVSATSPTDHHQAADCSEGGGEHVGKTRGRGVRGAAGSQAQRQCFRASDGSDASVRRCHRYLITSGSRAPQSPCVGAASAALLRCSDGITDHTFPPFARAPCCAPA